MLLVSSLDDLLAIHERNFCGLDDIIGLAVQTRFWGPKSQQNST